MLKNFKEIKEKIKSLPKQRVAVAVAEDEEVLMAIRQAYEQKLADAILVGDEKKIHDVAKEHKIDLEGFQIINQPNPLKATDQCCLLIHERKADVIMKGLLDTSIFMKSVLNKETGLNYGHLLSHVAVFELKTYSKLLMVTDAAINIAPDLNTKAKIIQNAARFAKSLGYQKPLVAICSAVEKINESMPSTMEAAILSKMAERGQIKDCVVDGPLAIDNAISLESAKTKKIDSPVAGQADIILCNNIESANYLYKTLNFLCSDVRCGAIVTGASIPIILTSRADSHENKFLSIVLAVLSSAPIN